jgi:hypothetical protein
VTKVKLAADSLQAFLQLNTPATQAARSAARSPGAWGNVAQRPTGDRARARRCRSSRGRPDRLPASRRLERRHGRCRSSFFRGYHGEDNTNIRFDFGCGFQPAAAQVTQFKWAAVA